MNNSASPVSFSLDRLCAFARDAIIGHGMAKSASGGLSEQLWAGLRESRKVAFCDDMRDSFDGYIMSLRDSGKKADKLEADKLADWKKGSPLAQRISECRRVLKAVDADASLASVVWACDSLHAALKAIKPTKAEPAKPEPTIVEKPEETVADSMAGADILADLRAYLAAASEEDRLSVICALDDIINGV